MQLDQRHWLPDDVLYKGDRAGMLNSLEIRTPYLAREVAEFANSVQASMHLAGHGKKLLRNALRTYFPGQSTSWRKVAFRVPGNDWLRGPLRATLLDQAVNGTMVTEGYVDRDYLRTAVEQHVKGSDRTAVLWPVLAFGLWLDRYASRS